jgi:two-component system, OmpR family, phosphate regulon sensor histidine kinase PhoR
MRRRIFARVLAGYVAVILLAIVVSAVYTLRLTRDVSFEALTRGLESAARTAAVPVSPLLGEGSGPALDALVASLGREGGVRFTVIDPAGVVRADSQERAAAMENHASRPEVATALRGGVGASQRFSGTVRRWMIYSAVPVTGRDGGVIAVVRTAAYAEELETATRRGRDRLVLFSLVLFTACLLSALAFSRTVTSPLRDLAGVVDRFAAGDFGARLHLRGRDEIKALADAFNLMAGRVQALFVERARQAQELDGIFSSVQQGICVLDSAGRIVRSNRGFEELASVLPVQGRTLWEAVRAPQLTELVQVARRTGERQSAEVALGEMIVLGTVQRMEGRSELIVVLHDISDIRRLETVKRDFVVNASHELRTPLTSIVGSLEMLEGQLDGEPARWVDAIRRNAERMSAIVRDMLILSRLEAHGVERVVERVDLERLLADVTGMFRHRAEAQGIDLSLGLDGKPPSIAGDAFLLEQMLVNLIDNALKYTEKGSVTVTCAPAAGPDGGAGVRIEVADTGIGIPEESLPRIFERFYVVDKSRSRKLGGTGLGLAIVKHIVVSHGGAIDVRSTAGTGTRFTVTLPDS